MRKILVVDDAAFMRVTIKNMLLKNGYEVVGEAENGKIAVEKYIALKPDIVTMDITMPVMNGLSALKTIVELDSGANCIMVTAMGQQETVKEAILAGARGYVVKPFREEVIINALRRVEECMELNKGTVKPA